MDYDCEENLIGGEEGKKRPQKDVSEISVSKSKDSLAINDEHEKVRF